jgi:hypothetical protein
LGRDFPSLSGGFIYLFNKHYLKDFHVIIRSYPNNCQKPQSFDFGLVATATGIFFARRRKA